MLTTASRFVACFSCLALWACANDRIATVKVLQVPEVKEATEFRSLAIARFSGKSGQEITDAIEAGIVNAKVHDQPVYGNVVRLSLPPTMTIQSPGLSSFARSRGTDAFIVGEVTKFDVVDSKRNQKELVCTQRKDPSNLFSKCMSWNDKVSACSDRAAELRLHLKVFSGKNGNLVFNEVLSEKENSSGCGDTLPTAAEKMREVVLASMTAQVLRKLVPNEATMSIEMMMPEPGFQFREKVINAIAFAHENRIDRACKLLSEANQPNVKSLSLSYNLGVCEETQGALSKARHYYEIADSLSETPNRLITEALKRTAKNSKNSCQLVNSRKDLKITRRVIDSNESGCR